MFENEPGIIVFGNTGNLRKRHYLTLRFVRVLCCVCIVDFGKQAHSWDLDRRGLHSGPLRSELGSGFRMIPEAIRQLRLPLPNHVPKSRPPTVPVCLMAGPQDGLIGGLPSVRAGWQLEDCSCHEKDKTPNARNYSDDMERSPAITELLPIGR